VRNKSLSQKGQLLRPGVGISRSYKSEKKGKHLNEGKIKFYTGSYYGQCLHNSPLTTSKRLVIQHSSYSCNSNKSAASINLVPDLLHPKAGGLFLQQIEEEERGVDQQRCRCGRGSFQRRA